MSIALSSEWDQKLPGWLQRGHSRDYLDTIVWTIDALMEGVYQAREGILALDDDPPPDAVPLVARDRNLPPGFVEGAKNYFRRAASWRQLWKASGRVRPMLECLAAVWGPSPPKMRVVREFGWAVDGIYKARWTTRNSDGTYENHIANPSNWDWDGDHLPCREWVIIYAPTLTPVMGEDGLYNGLLVPVWGDSGTRGDGTFDKKTIGTTAWREYVTRTQHVIDLFKPAHVKVQNIIIAFDPASFDPTAAPGSPGMPDGTWGNWSKEVAGVQVRTRLATARYWKGV